MDIGDFEHFLELIRVSIGSADSFSFIPTKEDWKTFYSLSKKHTILGICFNGIDKLFREYPEQVVNLPMQLKMLWIGAADGIRQRNELLNYRCTQLSEKLLADGFRSCILKGQGVAALYGEELQYLRQSGDIDIWVDGGREAVIDYVMGIVPTRDFDQKHIQFHIFDDVDVEAHWIPVNRCSFKFDRLLGQYFDFQRERQFSDGSAANYPTADFQLVHQLLHVYGHYVYEGVGIRQIMDLYFSQVFCVKFEPEKVKEVLDLFSRMSLMRFVAAAQWVMYELFANKTDASDWLICEPDENEGRRLLAEIVSGGNFGQFDARNRVKNESFMHRFWRRWSRKWRMWRYDLIGTLLMPAERLKLEFWMRAVRRRYNIGD